MVQVRRALLCVLLLAFPVLAENVKTGCASGCDYDDCGDWATYLDGLGAFSEDQKLDVQGTMTGRCYLTSLQLNGHKVRIIGNASCRDDDGVVDAGDCTITSDHSTATILADSSGTYEVDGVVVKNTGTRGDGVAEAAGIWLNDTVAFTLSNSMVVFAGSGDADNANNAGVLVGYDITSLVVYNTGFQGWTTGIKNDMRDSDSFKVYNSTFRGNTLKDLHIECWRGASEVVDLRNVLILSSSDSLYFNDTCDSITKTDVFCSAADTDCSDYSKSISFDGTGADFRIASASDGVDEGTDLSAATPAITTDMRGAERGATYDVGAYEITGGAEPTPSPSPTATAEPTVEPTPSPTPSGELILEDDFDGGAASEEWSDITWEANWYEPDTAIEKFKTSPTPVSGSHVIHYYAREGTNEEGPFYLGLDLDSETVHELYVSWHEYFDGEYCWPTGSQKMLRIGNFSDGTVARKDFTMVTRESGSNVGYEYQCGSDEGICPTGMGHNSETAHPLNTWVHWVMHIKLNTAEASDGFIKLYKDGALFITNLNLDLRGSDATGFDRLWLGGNYSQEGGIGTLACDGSRYLDDIAIYSGEPTLEPIPATPTPTPDPVATPTPTATVAPTPTPAANFKNLKVSIEENN